MARPCRPLPLSPWIHELRALQPQSEERRFRRGQVIFSTGEVGDGFHVVRSGRVRISAEVGPGESRTLAVIGPGDFFGEMAVLDDAPRSATATAEEPTITQFLARHHLLALLERRPRLALNIIRAFSTRMRALNHKYVDEVVQAERLAVIGRFATTIVHDFKNPLAIIGLATDLACRPRTRAAERRQLRAMVTRQVGRMKTMLQELIDFTRPGGQKPRLRALRFAPFLRRLVEEARPELAQRGVVLNLEAPLPDSRARIDPPRLSRLFLNLWANSVDALGESGTIAVRCRREGGELRIEVQDNGPGIAPALLPTLFRPFATHGKPHGTGLGLAICRRIAEDHGGLIRADNPPGGGARFTLVLPAARP